MLRIVVCARNVILYSTLFLENVENSISNAKLNFKNFIKVKEQYDAKQMFNLLIIEKIFQLSQKMNMSIFWPIVHFFCTLKKKCQMYVKLKEKLLRNTSVPKRERKITFKKTSLEIREIIKFITSYNVALVLFCVYKY